MSLINILKTEDIYFSTDNVSYKYIEDGRYIFSTDNVSYKLY